ncbi:DoxX family protein [Croceitalea dokdonensis DOKDO 023]|uniref:DoxX family protein n=1 Tax=Croceitalea dokdonensis DOKDO 023 TaxID=1300341 RepID=A0A0P7B022_9FLAO|nr:DoxX family protein [Croceitalea dokdonensis]KPM31226.1 DoxX family protein [Croceitalea dokdonensis DOKDO 023]
MNVLKQIYNPGTEARNLSLVLLLLRVAAGIFMLTHGLGKLDRLFGDEVIQFADPLGVGATASLALTVFAEVFCSILLILGLGTRLAAIPLLITMLVAALIVHSNDGFGRQELGLLYAVNYITLLVLGAGKYSLDYLISKNKK